MAESAGDKTFDPTPHRRQEARDKGQVVFSQDLGSAVMLMAGVLLLMMLGGGVLKFSAELMRHSLGEVPDIVPSVASTLKHLRGLAIAAAGVTLPILGLLLVASVLTSILQIGFLFVPERVTPDITRLSPLAGFRRIFSLQGSLRLGFGLFKVLVVAAIAGTVFGYYLLDLRQDEQEEA